MMTPIVQYFDRAAWAIQVATKKEVPPNARSHLAAAALHACRSLTEALDQAAADDANKDNVELKAAIAKLPHRALIESARHMDLHGQPLPVCDPKLYYAEMRTKPDQPMEIGSSHGVAVMVRWDGLKPNVTRSPKDLKHSVVDFGQAVTWGCDHGEHFIYDPSTTKTYHLLTLVHEFLNACVRFLPDDVRSVIQKNDSGAEARSDTSPGASAPTEP